MTFGEALSIMLSRYNVTQAELAERTGLSTAHINRLVKGSIKNVSIVNAFKIADALGVSLNELRSLMES